MTDLYSSLHQAPVWRRLALTALLGGSSLLAAQAQSLDYAVSGAANVTGTYTDLGTTGTAITTANTDDANSAAQAIGFTFTYNSTAFTQFVLNTNGLIRLGSAAPSTASLYYDNNQNSTATDPLQSTNAADINLVMPFNFDLVPGTAGGTEYRVATTGTAGSRVCTVQWKNVSDKAGAGTDVANGTQYANFSFQLKLYEATGAIEFVYGAAVASTGTAGIRFPNVGLKGSGLADGQLLLGSKLYTAAWSTTTFGNTNYTTNGHDITTTALPDAGRTYRFTRLAANDAGVTTIYTYGKLATPATLPHAVQAVVTNAGSAALTNLPVTLSVTGANTFTNTQTVTSLAVGASATVTFAAYPATLTVGTNTVTVSVPADANAANNSATYGQQVTTNRVSYTDPATALVATGVGVGAANGLLAAKYTLPGATNYLSDVVATFAASTVTPTTFQVVVYDATGTGGTPGNLLHTSATQTRTAAAGAITVALPSIQVGSAFYIGLKELDTNLGLAYQTEVPLRPTTYYYRTSGSWTPIPLNDRFALEFGLAATPACPTPTGVAVSAITATTATVAFTGPTTGTAYKVIYGLAGFNPATGGNTLNVTTSPVNLTGLTPSTNYQVYVQATCGTTGQSLQAGPVSFSTPCAVATVTTFPYSEGFDGVTAPAVPCGITIADVNADGKTWALMAENPNSTPNAMRYTYNTAAAANDWFFTPPLALQTGLRYQLQFKYRARSASFPEGLEVKYGNAATPAGQTTTLFSNTSITNITYATTVGGTAAGQVASFVPATAGTYYVGFHAISAADEFYLYVDDIAITAATVTGTRSSVAAGFRAEASPVPFSDKLTLNLNTLVSGTLQLTLHDTMGRLVRESKAVAPAGASSVSMPEVASLPAGVYMLTVRQGGNTQVIRVAHE